MEDQTKWTVESEEQLIDLWQECPCLFDIGIICIAVFLGHFNTRLLIPVKKVGLMFGSVESTLLNRYILHFAGHIIFHCHGTAPSGVTKYCAMSKLRAMALRRRIHNLLMFFHLQIRDKLYMP